jgi:hypothetical protein
MERWGLCSGCLLGVGAAGAVGVAVWQVDGIASLAGWVAFVVLAWGAVMSVYQFDRPARHRPAPRST